MESEDKKVYERMRDMIEDKPFNLGPYYRDEFKTGHIFFNLARYKFAMRMIQKNPKLDVLELGCAEGIGAMLLANVANFVLGIDFEDKWINWAKENLENQKVQFKCEDFIGKDYGKFDAIVSLDVIEHISREREDQLLDTIFNNLKDSGFCIIGTPNITANQYASAKSQEGHVNMFDAERLEKLFFKKFNNVFVFGMNDEIVHTGFKPMSHYLMILACNKK